MRESGRRSTCIHPVIRECWRYARLLKEAERVLRVVDQGLRTIKVKTCEIHHDPGAQLSAPDWVDVGAWQDLRLIASDSLAIPETWRWYDLRLFCEQYPLGKRSAEVEVECQPYLIVLRIAIDFFCDRIAKLSAEEGKPVPWPPRSRCPRTPRGFARIYTALRDLDPPPSEMSSILRLDDECPLIEAAIEAAKRSRSGDSEEPKAPPLDAAVQTACPQESVGEVAEKPAAGEEAGLAETAKAPPRYSLVRSAGGWMWTYEGKSIIARDCVGMPYVAELLRNPGVRVNCEGLEAIRAGRPAVSTIEAKELPSGDDAATPSYSGEKPQEIMDKPALAEAKRRLNSNRDEQQKAKKEQNVLWLAELEDEERGILEELRGVIRPGGKSKAFQGEREKRAARVRMAVKRMIESIKRTKGGEKLAEHLKASIDFGSAVLYFGKLPWDLTPD